MRVTRLRFGYVPLFLVLHATLADSALAAEKGFVVQQARVFDGERAHPNMTVVVRDGVIESVQSETIVPPGFEVIDGSGRTLLPGLFDSHAHMRNDALTQALAFGVTTVLDMFADPEWAAERRTEQQRGRVTSRADLFSAGLLVTAPGAHGTQYEIKVPTITSPGEAREAVEFRIAQGSDYIKIIYEPERNSIDSTTMRAVIEEAHRHERMAVVHVVTLEHARTAIAAGADGIVHLFAERVADSDFLELISRRGAFVVPTLSFIAPMDGDRGAATLAEHPQFEPYLSDEHLENLLWSRPPGRTNPWFKLDSAAASLRMLASGDVQVLAGSDAPNLGTAWGASLHGELELMVRAGLSPAAALTAATSAPAQAFGLHDRGRIAPGMRADLLLVDGDPTEHIVATRNIVAIWKQGVRFDRDAYRRSLKRKSNQ